MGGSHRVGKRTLGTLQPWAPRSRHSHEPKEAAGQKPKDKKHNPGKQIAGGPVHAARNVGWGFRPSESCPITNRARMLLRCGPVEPSKQWMILEVGRRAARLLLQCGESDICTEWGAARETLFQALPQTDEPNAPIQASGSGGGMAA